MYIREVDYMQNLYMRQNINNNYNNGGMAWMGQTGSVIHAIYYYTYYDNKQTKFV